MGTLILLYFDTLQIILGHQLKGRGHHEKKTNKFCQGLLTEQLNEDGNPVPEKLKQPRQKSKCKTNRKGKGKAPATGDNGNEEDELDDNYNDGSGSETSDSDSDVEITNEEVSLSLLCGFATKPDFNHDLACRFTSDKDRPTHIKTIDSSNTEGETKELRTRRFVQEVSLC